MTMTNKDAGMNHDYRDPFPNIEARPLGLPDFINVQAKNANVSLRWVNRSAGEGQRLDEMIYAGFVPARPDECQVRGQAIPPSLIKDGKIIRGDLILMKIDRAAYDGALKYNWQRAVHRLHPGMQLKTGQGQLSRAVKEVGVPLGLKPSLAQKLKAYRPGAGESTADPAFMEEGDKLPSEKGGEKK